MSVPIDKKDPNSATKTDTISCMKSEPKTTKKIGTKTGAATGNKTGTKAPTKAGTKTGAKAGTKTGTKTANQVKVETISKSETKSRKITATQSRTKIQAKTSAGTLPSKETKDITLVKARTVKKKVLSTKTRDHVNKKSPKGTNKEIAQLVMAKLCETYPDADCELNYQSTFQLLTAVILSAQCTDKLVNKVTEKLFAKFPTAHALAQADLEEVKTLIKATGYFNAKAKNIQACAQELVTRFGGQVPATMEELITLPGVGRKTANVVLGVANNIPGWTVDTHVQRLCKRLNFSQQSDPYKIELELQKLFPNMDWSKLSITLIWHGRRQCFARNPQCISCPVKELCPQAQI